MMMMMMMKKSFTLIKSVGLNFLKKLVFLTSRKLSCQSPYLSIFNLRWRVWVYNPLHMCLTTMGTWRVNTFPNLNVITSVPLYIEKPSLARRKHVIILHWRGVPMIKMNLLFSRALNDHKAHPLPVNMQSPDLRAATWEVLTLRKWKWHKAQGHCRVDPSCLKRHERGECGATCLVGNPRRSAFL